MNDHELTVLVEAAASGAVNSRASIHGGPDWEAMDAGAKNSVREHALPFIFHGTKALADLGYTKPRTIETAEELDALGEGAVILDRDGMALQKTRWNFSGTGWCAINGTRDIEADVLASDALPATVLYKPEPQS